MPHALTMLRTLGVEAPGKPFHGITYIDGQRRVTHSGTLRAVP